MKRIKKGLALLLTAAMCLGLLTTFAGAEGFWRKPMYKIVNLGDSTSVGFGLDDYGLYSFRPYISSPNLEPHYEYNNGLYMHGFLDCISKDAYPVRIYEYLKSAMPYRDVQFINLGLSGQRVNELRAILDPEYEGDSLTKDLFSECNTYGLIPQLFDLSKWGNDLHTMFTEEIKDADLITLDCCMNSFTEYFNHRILAVLSGDEELMAPYTDDTLASLADEVLPGIKPLADAITAKFVEVFGDALPDKALTAALDTVVYCFTDFCICFNKTVGLIRELNPHARILVGGAYNPFNGLSVIIDGVKIDGGSFVSVITELVNTYMTAIEPQRNTYSFIDLPDDIETFREYFAAAGDVWGLSREFRSHLIDDIFGVDHGLYAVDIINKVRTIGAEMGVYDGTGKYSSLWPEDIVEAFDDVEQNGEDAVTMNKLLVDQFSEIINLLIASANVTEFDINLLISIAVGFEPYALAVEYMGRSFDELTPEEQSALAIATISTIRSGALVHFSYKGCDQKTQAAFKALSLPLPASVYGRDALKSVGVNALLGLINTIWQPLADLLGSFFGDARFSSFLSATAGSMLPFVTRFLSEQLR